MSSKTCKLLNLAALTGLLVSCNQPPADNSKIKTSPRASVAVDNNDDAVQTPKEVAGAFADFNCDASTMGIGCKIRRRADGLEINLNQFKFPPSFELYFSQSKLPSQIDGTAPLPVPYSPTTSQAANGWGLNIAFSESDSTNIVEFLKANVVNPDISIGLAFKSDAQNGDKGRLIARLDRCVMISYLTEWGLNPPSANTLATLPTSVYEMLKTQTLVNIALKNQSTTCAPGLAQAKKTFSQEALKAAEQWFTNTGNSFKQN
jgi:hypothetical protein